MKKIVLIALILCLLFTAGCKNNDSSDTKTGADDGDASTLTMVSAPPNASEEEKLAYLYADAGANLYQIGMMFMDMGMRRCAESTFALALTNVSSMRYAVDCLLEMKGEGPHDDIRLRDWDMIAALGWASPFPYFFEGVIHEAQGEGAAAAECYRKASLNPNLLEDGEQFKVIADLDENALKSLQTSLEELEDTIIDIYGLRYSNIPRDENNFNTDFLREKAMECLEADEEDLLGALGYYLAALQTNPFDGDNYANIIVVCIFICDGEMAAGYLSDGLLADPENVRLAYLQDMVKEALEN